MSGPTELLQKPEPQAESSRALQWRRQQGCHTQWGSRRALRLMTQLNAFVPLTVFMPHILHTNPNTQKEDRNNQMPLIQASQFDDTSDWMPLTPITSQKETKFSSIFMSLTLLCLMAFLARQFGSSGLPTQAPTPLCWLVTKDVLPCHSVSFLSFTVYLSFCDLLRKPDGRSSLAWCGFIKHARRTKDQKGLMHAHKYSEHSWRKHILYN